MVAHAGGDVRVYVLIHHLIRIDFTVIPDRHLDLKLLSPGVSIDQDRLIKSIFFLARSVQIMPCRPPRPDHTPGSDIGDLSIFRIPLDLTGIISRDRDRHALCIPGRDPDIWLRPFIHSIQRHLGACMACRDQHTSIGFNLRLRLNGFLLRLPAVPAFRNAFVRPDGFRFFPFLCPGGLCLPLFLCRNGLRFLLLFCPGGLCLLPSFCPNSLCLSPLSRLLFRSRLPGRRQIL